MKIVKKVFEYSVNYNLIATSKENKFSEFHPFIISYIMQI